MRNEIITFTSPKASVSEIFRTLRTNVQFMNASNERKSVLFTSAQAGEGKSWIAANLAITFAQAGKKVILVDTDMRRGRQDKIFDLPNNKGLSNYLILSVKDSQEVLGEYIQQTMIDNLYVITAGIVPPNPSELLTSKKMIDLMKMLEEIADVVIFDSTPSTMVTDAMVISRYVGSTIIVASHKKTKIETLKLIKRNIENVGGRVSGVILNKVPLSKKEYGKSYYYESSVVMSNGRKKWSPNIGKVFNKISNVSEPKAVKEAKVEEVKKKLDKVDEEKINKITNEAGNKEDPELNVLLKQLSKYLESK